MRRVGKLISVGVGDFAYLGMAELAYSQKVKQAEEAIRHVKSLVPYRGLNTAGGWIRRPLDVPEKFGARIASKILENRMIDGYGGQKQHPSVIIRDGAALGRKTGTGNCSELSAIAFEFLQFKCVAPIDYFAVYRGAWNHAFVVLYRDNTIPVSDFTKWSPAAVVCDPLYDRAGDAGYLMKWYGHMFPLGPKDVMYRLDS
jgi:hypothetical protein